MCPPSVSMFSWTDVANRSHALQRSRSHVYCSSLSVWQTDAKKEGQTNKTQQKRNSCNCPAIPTGRGTAADPAVPLLVQKPDGFAGLWSDSAKLVIVGLHQKFLLFLVVAGLITGAVVTLGLITSFASWDLLRLHVPVDQLLEVRLSFFRKNNVTSAKPEKLEPVHGALVHRLC